MGHSLGLSGPAPQRGSPDRVGPTNPPQRSRQIGGVLAGQFAVSSSGSIPQRAPPRRKTPTTAAEQQRIVDLERENRELRRPQDHVGLLQRVPTVVLVDYLDWHRPAPRPVRVEPTCRVLRGPGCRPPRAAATQPRPDRPRPAPGAFSGGWRRSGRCMLRTTACTGSARSTPNSNAKAIRSPGCTVARLMRADGLRGVSRAIGPWTTIPGVGP